jgi:hypothetical protein
MKIISYIMNIGMGWACREEEISYNILGMLQWQ